MLPNVPFEVYPVVSAGVDWLTCTGSNGSSALTLEHLADSVRTQANHSGARESAQSRLGFEGFSLDHFFFGRRPGDVMMQLSGPMAVEYSRDAIMAATNVSRLDLQVTIWTQGTVLQLARDGWDHLKTLPRGNHRPRSFSLVIGHPQGQTLYLNSRSSDNFGRLYDKGVESKLGPAGLVWRYEVEFKRRVALQESHRLARQDQLSEYVTDRVHRWMTVRGADPRFPPADGHLLDEVSIVEPTRDVLRWFNESLSKTVATQVKQHGLIVVLESLGLLKLVQALEVKENGSL